VGKILKNILKNTWRLKNPVLLVVVLSAVSYVCYAGVTDREAAQNNFPGWRATTSIHAGFILEHRQEMGALIKYRPFIAELSLAKRARGEKGWHSFFNFPEYGASFMMLDFGSPVHLGKAYGVYPFMNFFLRDNERWINFSIRVGAGVAYIERVFDRETNYENIALSTHFNALLSMQVKADVRLTNDVSAFAGAALTHFSNGAFRRPNAGVNIITGNVGVGYAFGAARPLKTSAMTGRLDKRWNYRLYASGGIKEIPITEGVKYVASGLSLEASRRHSAYTRFGGTLDLLYDPSEYVMLQHAGEDINRLQTVKLGATAGYEMIFGSLSANFQAGTYIYKRSEVRNIYQRLALRYAITSHINVHLGLKAHLARADYIELALGYRIR